MADPTTFEASRLMYWPSCCSDGEYVFQHADAPFVAADGVLAAYTDWKDYTAWPQVPGAVSYQKLAMKQGDPDTKPGIVGVFNRTYGDVFNAIDALLPGIYDPVDNDSSRLTYLGGSTTGGAVTYDHGKFLYSHHATDPCSNRLVNCFDLVRLHKFGDLDDEAKPDTPTHKLPSYSAMCEFASNDRAVIGVIDKERSERAAKDFIGIAGTYQTDNQDNNENWKLDLPHNKEGNPIPTIMNIQKIFENDPNLKGKFALNTFKGYKEVLGQLPWSKEGKKRRWTDTDYDGLYCYMEYQYCITKRNSIDSALGVHMDNQAFDEVENYVNSLKWDGVPRLDTLFIDYLGAEDNEYTRTVTRKIFTAAIYRALEPGCKFDPMLILCGPQGIGKSTILNRMGRGWFTDNIRTFEGKEAAELLRGAWLVEIAELDAFRKSDVSRIKQFLSTQCDNYRPAYGRETVDYPRRCVFFGTCNQSDFLRDDTGNRRFWPVDVGVNKTARKAWDITPEEVNQIWAEAKQCYDFRPPLTLDEKIEAMAKKKQEEHREVDPWANEIKAFVNTPIPADWSKWPLDRRRTYWGGYQSDNDLVKGSYELVQRTRVCAEEIWLECLGNRISNYHQSDRKRINSVLKSLPNWREKRAVYRAYNKGGKVTFFERKIEDSKIS